MAVGTGSNAGSGTLTEEEKEIVAKAKRQCQPDQATGG